MVRTMHISTWVWASWTTPVMPSVVPVVWPGMVSVGIVVTFAVVSAMMGLWSRPTASVPVFVMVVWGWSIVVSISRFWSVLTCRCTWRWYPIWAIYYYVAILITLEASNTGTMSAIWPNSWHWKQQSSSWDMTFTVEDGVNVAVSCCVAWSFSTSDIASVRVCGPFSCICTAKVWAFLSSLTKILMVAVLFVKLHLLASLLKWWMYAARDFFFFLLYLHKSGIWKYECQSYTFLITLNHWYHPKICLMW